MIITFPDGKTKNIDEKNLKEGDLIGDWQFVGNTTRPGDSKWNEFVNVKTGDSTLVIHKPHEVPTCTKHYFEYIDNNFNYQCRACFVGGRLNLGYNKLVNGKIVKIASS